MVFVLQAAIAVKLVNVTAWRVVIKKSKGSLEACYMAGRGGVLPANLVLTSHKSIDLLKQKVKWFFSQTLDEGDGNGNNLRLRRRDRRP